MAGKITFLCQITVLNPGGGTGGNNDLSRTFFRAFSAAQAAAFHHHRHAISNLNRVIWWPLFNKSYALNFSCFLGFELQVCYPCFFGTY